MNTIYKNIILMLLVFLSISATAQSKYYLKIIPDSRDGQKVINSIRIPGKFETSTQRHAFLSKILTDCYSKGYAIAGFSNIQGKDSTNMTAHFSLGKKMNISRIRRGNIPSALLSDAGIRKRDLSSVIFSEEEVSSVCNKILKYCENNGFPFAIISLDSLEECESGLCGTLNLEKGPKIVFDSIKVKGGVKISDVFLSNYLGIKEGALYNEESIKDCRQRMENLSYIRLERNPELLFTEDKAQLIIIARKRKASQFSGIAGILPDNERSGKFLLTGDVSLDLRNSFGRGEQIHLNWKALGQGTQDLKTGLVFPYLFGTPIGFDGTFNLYKKDTSYLDLKTSIGFRYILDGESYIKVFVENTSSDLLSTSIYEFAQTLPPRADYNKNFLGLEFNLDKLNYRPNPSSGFSGRLSLAGGTRVIKINPGINPLAYEDVQLKSNQYQFIGIFQYFIPLGKRICILTENISNVAAGSELLENELFRIGGLHTLKGFDEESILTSWHSIMNFEFRFLLDRNSHASLFWNGAYYEKHTKDSYVIDRPFGFGAGINFETRAGILSMYYALGKQFDNPIELRSGKIHLGIKSTF